jgi:hypothetical protein
MQLLFYLVLYMYISSYVYITTCFGSYAIIRYFIYLPELLHFNFLSSYMSDVGCHFVKILF